jgi:hypothetical protein
VLLRHANTLSSCTDSVLGMSSPQFWRLFTNFFYFGSQLNMGVAIQFYLM